MKRSMLVLALASFSIVASAADKPLPVTVANPVLPVEVSNADPIPVSVVPGSITHMGVAAADHVGLYLGSSSASTCPSGYAIGIRANPDGSFGGQFSIPQGKALVVTDFSIGIGADSGAAWNIGSMLVFELHGVQGTFPVWQIRKTIDETASVARQLWFTESLSTGAVIGPGPVCARMPNTYALLNNSSMVFGYLVDYQAQ